MNRRLLFTSVLIPAMLVVFVLVLTSAQPAVADLSAAMTARYVATSGVDGGPCSDPATPCRTIQYAIDRARSGDEVLVAAGVYTGTQTRSFVQWNRTFTFTQVALITKTLSLRGGFAAGAWVFPDPSSETIIDAEGHGRGITAMGTGQESVLVEGLTVTNGNYQGLGNPPGIYDLCQRTSGDCGGGVYARMVRLTLHNCVISRNDAGTVTPFSDGGGIYLWDVAEGSHIEGCSITNNQALSEDAEGGGLQLAGGSGVTIAGCTFDGNRAYRGGGAISISSPHQGQTIIEDTVIRNSTTFYGYNHEEGGAVLATITQMPDNEEALLMDRVTLQGNQSEKAGGAIYIHSVGDGPVSARLTNLILTGNGTQEAYDESSVIAVGASYSLRVELAHITAAANMAASFLWAGDPYPGHNVTIGVTNTIIVSATNAFSAEQSGGQVDIRHSHTLTEDVANLHHAISGAPLFQASDPMTGDPLLDASYHLKAGSPAIDMGADAHVTTDIDDQVRPWGKGPDIGADERGSKPLLPVSVPLLMKG